MADDRFAKLNVVVRRTPDGSLAIAREPLPEMPAELHGLLKEQK
jgi:hypothetical protein